MKTQVCHSIRDSLLSFFNSETMVTAYEDECVITLPMKTLDDRFLDVYVRRTVGDDVVVVHDGGRTASELFAQGIHLTEAKRAALQSMARRYEVSFDGSDDTFKIGSKWDALLSAILAVAQCASLAMHDVLGHCPAIEKQTRPRAKRSGLTSNMKGC